jgi:hypothetical protein
MLVAHGAARSEREDHAELELSLSHAVVSVPVIAPVIVPAVVVIGIGPDTTSLQAARKSLPKT